MAIYLLTFHESSLSLTSDDEYNLIEYFKSLDSFFRVFPDTYLLKSEYSSLKLSQQISKATNNHMYYLLILCDERLSGSFEDECLEWLSNHSFFASGEKPK